jgi:hypothetical protein
VLHVFVEASDAYSLKARLRLSSKAQSIWVRLWNTMTSTASLLRYTDFHETCKATLLDATTTMANTEYFCSLGNACIDTLTLDLNRWLGMEAVDQIFENICQGVFDGGHMPDNPYEMIITH